jgi:1-acyl-sn-glycerol-3-phosphate acyltransferase
VPLERRSRGRGIFPNAHIERLIDDGWNVVVFAEGTRSRNGRVGVMRSGAAVLAARHGVPIVPVHISGTDGAMPPGRNWMVRPKDGGRWARHTIRVSLGVPIRVGPGEDRLEVMETVRLFMATCGAETTPDPRLLVQRAAVVETAAQRPRAASGRRS